MPGSRHKKKHHHHDCQGHGNAATLSFPARMPNLIGDTVAVSLPQLDGLTNVTWWLDGVTVDPYQYLEYRVKKQAPAPGTPIPDPTMDVLLSITASSAP